MVALADIQRYADRIAERFRPQRIILFGSYAYGTPTPDSDVDLLVVMPDQGDPLERAMEIGRSIDHPGFPLDVLVRDPLDLRRRIADNDWFLADVTKKGRVLYEEQHHRVGGESRR